MLATHGLRVHQKTESLHYFTFILGSDEHESLLKQIVKANIQNVKRDVFSPSPLTSNSSKILRHSGNGLPAKLLHQTHDNVDSRCGGGKYIGTVAEQEIYGVLSTDPAED